MKFKQIEIFLEKILFASRWLMAPFYFGLIGALALLLYIFLEELGHLLIRIPHLTQTDAILGVLSLIDLSLAGKLLVIVIFSGYENFVSKIDLGDHEDQPSWKSEVDFSSMKLKILASIVTISGIHLLKVFMDVSKIADREIQWMLIIHVIFVVSGILLAAMDYIAVRSKILKH